jgi:hypothetical protein
MVINHMWRLQNMSKAIIRKKRALAIMLLGKADIGGNNPETARVKWERSDYIQGHNYQRNLLGALRDSGSGSQLGTVTDGSDELSLQTLDYSSNDWGAAEWPLTHRAKTCGIPAHEMKRFRGDELRTTNFIHEKVQQEMLSWESILNTDLNSATDADASRTHLAGWPHVVADYSLEAAHATYGTIDRSDSANAAFRGTVTYNQGTLGIADIQHLQNRTKIAGGTPDICVAGLTPYEIMQQQVQSYSHVTYNPTMSEFGCENFMFSGQTWLLENDAPSGTIGMLDSETWIFVLNEDKLTESGITYEPLIKSGYVWPLDIWYGWFCEHPAANGKMTGVAA